MTDRLWLWWHTPAVRYTMLAVLVVAIVGAGYVVSGNDDGGGVPAAAATTVPSVDQQLCSAAQQEARALMANSPTPPGDSVLTQLADLERHVFDTCDPDDAAMFAGGEIMPFRTSAAPSATGSVAIVGPVGARPLPPGSEPASRPVDGVEAASTTGP